MNDACHCPAGRRWRRLARRLTLQFVSIVFITFVCPFPLEATDLRSVLTQYALTSWSEKDGLPDASIYVLEQDADGYLWVGTQAGPYRFDGVRFTPWSTLVGNTTTAAATRALKAASDGSMWIGFGGQGGIAVFKRSLVRMYGQADGLPMATVSTLVEHPAGTMWAGTPLGLYRLHADRWERFGAEAGVPEGPVNLATVRRNGRLLVAASRTLLEFDTESGRFHTVAQLGEEPRAIVEDPHGRVTVSDQVAGYRRIDQTALSGEPLERGRGRSLLRDRRGNLWVGTLGQGLWRVRFDTPGAVQSVEHATALTGLLADGVVAMTEDREGNIWVGTPEGINRLTPHKVAQVTGIGLVAGVEPAHDGSLWVGTVDELLLMSAPDASSQAAPYALRGTRLRALHTDRAGTLWVATDRGLARWVNGSLRSLASRRFAAEHIDTITSGAPGEVWVFDEEHGLLRWRSGEFAAVTLPAPSTGARVEAAFTDSTGRAWFALSDGRVAVTEAETLKIYGEEAGLTAGVYQAIYEDHDHVIWLGGTAGLTRYRDHQFVTVRSDAGLPVSNLTAIVEDARGELWIGSGLGILQLQRADFDRLIAGPGARAQYLLLDRSDGLAGFPLVYSRNRRAIRSADGRLWFVTGRGITVVDPVALDAPVAPAPVRIEGVVSNARRIRPEPELALPAGTSRVEFEFTAVNLTWPLRQRFRYKLEGFDQDWIDGGTRRQAVYTNLPPRDYRFHVTSTDLKGAWIEEGATWSFSIKPAFYQTGWFLASTVAVVGLAIGGAWGLHVRSVRRRFALLIGERARLSRELHDTLLQSLVGVALQFDAMANDPQFPFSATQKQQFVRMRRRVEEYMREARQSIADLRSPHVEGHDLSVALREAAERAINGDEIQFEFAQHGVSQPVPARIENQLLKIGREAIGNAVRHANAGRITAELEFSERDVRLRVIDDGTGFDLRAPDGENHYGLTSMRERAEDLGGHLMIQTSAGRGTRVEAVVPLDTTHGREHGEITAH